MTVSALVTVTQAGGVAQVLTATNTVANVDPGATFTIALTTSTGVVRWKCTPQEPTILRDWPPSAGFANEVTQGLFSYTLTAPLNNSSMQMLSEVTDGNNPFIFYWTLNASEALDGAGTSIHRADVAAAAALATYVNTSGVLNASANGTLTIDGVLQAVGSRVLLPNGIAAATVDAGLYVVTAAGGASAKWQLTRVADMAQSSTLPSGETIEVGAGGALFGGTTWKNFSAAAIVVGTGSAVWVPRYVNVGSKTLSSGASAAITTVPLLAGASFTWNRVTPSGTASTVNYNAVSITPGAVGTATFVMQAQVAAGTVNASDGSAGTIGILNW